MKLLFLSLGLGLLIVGVALAYLMVIGLLQPGFVLGFLAYASSLSGLALGTFAAVQHGGSRQGRRD
jgi:hypothetical protein